MASTQAPTADSAAPPLLDLTIDNITPNTILINSQTDNARLKYVMSRLVSHLHDFARETRLSTDEWMTGLSFLIACGKICSDVRNVSRLNCFCKSPLALVQLGLWFYQGSRVFVRGTDLAVPGRNSFFFRTSWAFPY